MVTLKYGTNLTLVMETILCILTSSYSKYVASD